MTREEKSIFYDALANPVRREIVSMLSNGPMYAGHICQEINDNFMKISQPSLSRHLHVLERGGVVKVRDEATRRLFSLNEENIEVMKKEFNKLFG